MSGNARWIRLNVGWSSSDWIVVLRPAARLAWVELLAYTKVHGKSGRVKALSALAAGKKWGIATKDVQAMLDAAHAGDEPALETEDGDWKVCNWSTYQEPDRTGADRQARLRERNAVTADHNGAVTAHNGVMPDHQTSDATGVSSDATRTPDQPRISTKTPLCPVTTPLFVTRPLTVTLDPQTSTSGRKRARPKGWRFCPEDWKPKQGHADLANELDVDLAAEEAAFRVHEFRDPKSDADKAFYGWIRRAASHFRNGNGGGGRNGGRPPKKRRVAKDGTILSA